MAIETHAPDRDCENAQETQDNLDPASFVLVLSVGGSPQPLIESIRHYRPRNVIFVASRDSSAKVTEILQATTGIGRHEIITLTDFQDLISCVRDLRAGLPQKLAAMSLPGDILLIADITGGTKVMSSALTLAMMEFNSHFSYVGGTKRSKPDGMGQVESGHEQVIYRSNPWDALGLREAKNLAQAFNNGQYAAARQMADFIKSKDSDYRAFYDGLGMIIEAFQNWDRFNYQPAKSLFQQGLNRLRHYDNRGHANFRPLFAALDKAGQTLVETAREAALLQGKTFQPLAPGMGNFYLRDLIGNACRCAARGHHDDAVARLYSAVEKTAKIALAQLGLNNSELAKEAVFQACPPLAQKYADAASDILKLALEDSFLLFCHIAPEDPLAKAYREQANDLANALQSRNMSLLAHGYNPVSPEAWQKLHAVVLKFLNLTEEDIPAFPLFEPGAILF